MRVWLSLALGMLAGAAFGQVPVDNPCTTPGTAGNGWTSALRWNQVTDASLVKGLISETHRVDSAALHRVMQEISGEGGVLYFPPGTYYFDYDVTMSSHVVIRGAEPEGSRDATSDQFRLPTRFEFPAYKPEFSGAGAPNGKAFKKFTAPEKGAQNFGLVHLDINRASISFYTAWPEAFHENVVIFGVRHNNAASPDPGVPSRIQRDENRGWQRWPAWYKENMVACVKSRGLIDNCRLNDAITDDFVQPNYMTNDGYIYRQDTIRFHYAYHRGISLYVKDSINESSISGNYLRSSRHFDKLTVPARKIRMEQNVLVDTPDERVHDLVTMETNSSLLLQNTTRELFPVEHYVTGSGDTLFYRILKPTGYDPRKTYPLVLFLHGAGEQGRNVDHTSHFVQVFTSQAALQQYPCFVIIPILSEKGEWNSLNLREPPTWEIENSVKLVNRLTKTYHINRKQIYATGISAGGDGTWELIIRYPKVFAAAVPMASYWNLKPEYAKRLRRIPFWITAGAQDITIPVEYMRVMTARLDAAKIENVYREYSDVGHFSWVPLYTDQAFLPWLFSKSRK